MSEQHLVEDPTWDDTHVASTLQVVDAVDSSLDITTPLTTDEARHLTDTIRSTSEVLYTLLARAHAGRAWEALGFSSWSDYVREEFDMSRSRAYQILDQARVIAAIEEATPEGTHLSISEAAARDLKSIIGEVVPDIASRTEGIPADEAGLVVEEIVEDYREKVRDRREQDALEREEAEMDAADRRGFSDTSGGGRDYDTPYVPPPVSPVPSYADLDDEDDFDPALIRRNVQAAYDLYSSLQALRTMPDVQSVIDTIPVERRLQINESINASVDWLTQFRDQWVAQPWQGGDDMEDDEYYDDEDL